MSHPYLTPSGGWVSAQHPVAGVCQPPCPHLSPTLPLPSAVGAVAPWMTSTHWQLLRCILRVKADLWLLTTEGKASNRRRGNGQCVDFYLWCIKNYILGQRGWFSKETQASPFSNGNRVSPVIFLFKIQLYRGIVAQLCVLAYAYACENPSPQSGALPPLQVSSCLSEALLSMASHSHTPLSPSLGDHLLSVTKV